MYFCIRQDKPKLRDILPNNCSDFLRTLKIKKDEKEWRNDPRWKWIAKGMWQINEMYDHGWLLNWGKTVIGYIGAADKI